MLHQGAAYKYKPLNRRTGGYIGLEKKYLDERQAGDILASATGFDNMIDPTTNKGLGIPSIGTGPTQRNGRYITVVGMNIRLIITNAVDKDVIYRCMVVRDKQTNRAQCNPGLILQDHDGNPNDVLSYRNLEYQSRFDVLYDKILAPENSLWNATDDHSNEPHTILQIALKMKDKVTFTDTDADIASVQDISYHLVLFTNTVTSGTPQYSYFCRTRFYE